MIHPKPLNPPVPIARGPNSHSPLPTEIPKAIIAGPIAYLRVSLTPTFSTPNTSSGVGRSSTSRGGRLTPSSYVP